LHWVLDVVFHDDLARLRTANGPHNMAIIKHIAMNLVRNPKDSHSLKNRRKLANLNQDYLAQLIRQKENQPETIPLDQGCPTNCRSNVAVAGRLKGGICEADSHAEAFTAFGCLRTDRRDATHRSAASGPDRRCWSHAASSCSPG
jgi:hypothetical protein